MPREFTIDEVEHLGRALGPHFRMIVRDENKPIVDEIANLKKRASLWGAVSGSITAIGGLFMARMLDKQ